MNRNKIFCSSWHIKNIVEINKTMWSISCIMANVANFHSSSICGVNLIAALILVSDGQFLQFTSDVIGHSTIGVPVCVDVVGIGSSKSSRFLFWNI
jgi:hypothetical protein